MYQLIHFTQRIKNGYLMSNKYGDQRLSKAERKTITKSRKYARALTKDGDPLAIDAARAHRALKAGR